MLAKANTVENPKDRAIIIAKIALKTEAQPLTHHAQGIKSLFSLFIKRMPMGNGIPIKKLRGVNTTTEIKSLLNNSCPSSK